MDVGLRQRSALNPLLFIAVVDVISRKPSTRDILRKLTYADDLAVVADNEADLRQERLVEWKEIFGRHGLALSLEKTLRSRYETGWEETEPMRQLCISGWRGLRGRQHGDGNSGECMEESGWGDI